VQTRELYIGIMSGTSLDGADAVLADLSSPHPRLLGSAYIAFDDELRQELLALSIGGASNELERAGRVSITLTKVFHDAALGALKQSNVATNQVSAIGCHGQTVRHRPEFGFTIQLGNPSLLAELSGIPVVADFRNRDIAAGGQGAPLVPAFHKSIFHSPQKDRVIVNIGGIANLTYLHRNGDVIGFDCGPGNILMDAWTEQHLGRPYDDAGIWATTGEKQSELFDMMWQEPYFHKPPPKSTGRERFNLEWLESMSISKYQHQDVQRTLLHLTAYGIAHGIHNHCGATQQVFLCGGGAKNSALREALQNMLPNIQVTTTQALGIPVMQVEALAFAWLAQQTLHGKPGNLPMVTGARHSSVLGAIYAK